MSDPLSLLGALPRFGAGVGLHRVAWFAEACSSTPWLAQLDAIKVTGSNGKGSVCAMLASMLGALGITRGLYTSPHLLKLGERFGLNGRAATDHDLAPSLAWFQEQHAVYARRFPADSLSAFEALTAIALHYYARHAPATLVAEAGIGGRYDSTRMIPGQWVGLVSLDLEHAALLGDRLELIAYDKADLCPEGGTLVTGRLDPEIVRRLRAYCEMRRVRLIDSSRASRYQRLRYTATSMRLDLQLGDMRWHDLEIGLQGRHQIDNAAVAITLLRGWTQRHRPDLGDAGFGQGVAQGLATVDWPGRFQRIQTGPAVYVDVGHTPAAIDRLVETTRDVLGGDRVVLVVGVSSDKEVEAIVTRLLPLAEVVICTRARHQGSAVASIAEIVERHAAHTPLHRAERLEDALALARDLALQQHRSVLVAGSLFLAVEALQVASGAVPQAWRLA